MAETLRNPNGLDDVAVMELLPIEDSPGDTALVRDDLRDARAKAS
jgi:hypothetical protein